MRNQSVASAIASAFQARLNCEETKNAEWFTRWTDRIESLVKERLPSGSGFDNGTTFDYDKSDGGRLVFNTAFHHMDDHGYYDGWSEHNIIVTPTFGGIDLRVTGRDRRDIKEYIGEAFYGALTDTAPELESEE